MNQQREIIYKQRREVLESENIQKIVMDMIKPSIERIVEAHCMTISRKTGSFRQLLIS